MGEIREKTRHCIKRKQQRGIRAGVIEFILENFDFSCVVSNKDGQAWHRMISRKKANLLYKKGQFPSHLNVEDVTNKYLILRKNKFGEMIVITVAHYILRVEKNRGPKWKRGK